jgi:phospholipid/cholesterol/gamma-HCH transport system substrate-binding protein
MPLLNKRFSERGRVPTALVGLALLLVLVVLAFNSGNIVRSLSSETFTADFVEAGNLQSGAEVRLGGYNVGKVLSVGLQDDHVAVEFTVADGGTLGTDTRAAIKTSTALGTKFLQVFPSGPGRLANGANIPVARTAAPYDVSQILDQLTEKSQALDTRQLASSLSTLADTFQNTPPEVRSALTGVSRISETISSRDTALRALLSNAAGVTKVLADRNQQLQQIFTDGNQLLSELVARRDAIHALLDNATVALDQVQGLVRDNQAQLAPTLADLKGVTDLLIHNERALSSAITGLNNYAGALGEGVGGGPWFYAYVPNLIPANLLPSLPSLLGVPPGTPLPTAPLTNAAAGATGALGNVLPGGGNR